MHNSSTWKEKTFSGKFNQLVELYMYQEGVHHYSINSMLIFHNREKYVKMYKRFIEELKSYSKVIRVFSKGYVPISHPPPSKLQKNLSEVRITVARSNKDYHLVLTGLCLYYDMTLVTFGIDNKKDLVVQFPVFVQPYTQSRLIMYQIKTVPVLILNQNEQVQSYIQLKIHKPYIALNTETYITLRTQKLHTCKKIGYEYYCEELFVVKSKTRYSYASAIYFNLRPEIIKEIVNLDSISIRQM